MVPVILDDPAPATENIPCPACLSSVKRLPPVEIYHQRDEGKDYFLYQCPHCRVDFTWPMVNPTSEVYQKLFPEVERGFEVTQDWRHAMFFSENLPQDDLLDIGCGYGVFLSFAQQRGYRVTGVDYSEEKTEVARRQGVRDVVCAPIHEFLGGVNGKSWGIVTMLDVLEHVDAPGALLRNIRGLLREGGYLAITIPNRAYPRHLSGSKHYYPPHHLTRWSKDAIEDVLQRHGYRVVDLRVSSFGVRNITDALTTPLITGAVGAYKRMFFNVPRGADLRRLPLEALSRGGVPRKEHRRIILGILRGLLCTLFAPLILMYLVYAGIRNYQGSTIFVLAQKR